MSDKSSIEWTDATWNPIRGTVGRHHCVRVSEGCKHCYAATMNHRFGGPDYVKGADTPRLDEDALLQPLKWKRPRRIFVCSMTDLFMDEHSDEMIIAVFDVMRRCERHTFQVLTKRARRMRDLCARMRFDGRGNGRMYFADFPESQGYRIMGGNGCTGMPWVWLGVSCENQERADERIPDLLATPAAVRFVSAEPLLGPIRLDRPIFTPDGSLWDAMARGALGWVIVGGESGPGARPCDVSWIRSIKDQCQAADVPVFVKQLGRYPREHCGQCGRDIGRGVMGGFVDSCGPTHAELVHEMSSIRDAKGGESKEWSPDLRVREMPNAR